ncbi:MAG: DNA methylase [Lentisphaerae bacterium]|nr:MAG: DNA methylase [Lentisphaerota bacterium]
MPEKAYIAIDLKSFYASVECVDLHLDPLTTNLVVADESRTEKTICLAVSPSLKACGIPGRARLFEVVQKVREVNAQRRYHAPGHKFAGKSSNAPELNANPALELDYIVAMPRMARYMEISSQIYGIYLKYVAPEHIHVYSIDEVFIDATQYLKLYKLTAREFTMKLIQDVLHTTGITATAGIGTNLYLCKIAMDIVAKHIPADKDGVRIAELDEQSFRRELWKHQPLTDFWRIGHGYANKLNSIGLCTMGDVARMSVQNEDVLYRMFGINAELLIDHAWGWEPCTIAEIKAYKPESNSLSSGQVLKEPYDFDKARLVTMEMIDALVLDLVEKHLITDQLVLNIGYDIMNLTDAQRQQEYSGPVTTDRYGRQVPKETHGSINLGRQTSSAKIIVDAMMELFDRVVNPRLLIRRINVVANHLVNESQVSEKTAPAQPDLFTDYEALEKQEAAERAELEKEKRLQQAILDIKKKLGKNAVLKGMNLLDGATAKERNEQIGGHRK